MWSISNILFSVMLVPYLVLGSIRGCLMFLGLVIGFCGIGYFVRHVLAVKGRIALSGTLSIIGLASAIFVWPQTDGYGNVGERSFACVLVSLILVGLLVSSIRLGQKRASISGRAGFGHGGVVIGAFLASYAVMVVMLVGGLGGLGV